MKQVIKHLANLIFITIMLVACNENEEDQNNLLRIDQKNIFIEEVKAFVEIQDQANARTNSGDIDIIYDLGVFKDISLGDMLVFPIRTPEGLYVSGTDSTKRFPVESTSFAMAYKVEDELFVDFIQPVPTTNESSFTGY